MKMRTKTRQVNDINHSNHSTFRVLFIDCVNMIIIILEGDKHKRAHVQAINMVENCYNFLEDQKKLQTTLNFIKYIFSLFYFMYMYNFMYFYSHFININYVSREDFHKFLQTIQILITLNLFCTILYRVLIINNDLPTTNFHRILM